MIGQPFETAAWFDPTNPIARRETKKSLLIAMTRLQEHCSVVLGEFHWSVLSPGDDRVPEPPKVAPNGIKLMFVEAEVVALKPKLGQQSFVMDLEFADLELLRKITRRGAKKAGRKLTDKECDAIIDQLGPEMAERTLTQAILN